ncbi:MAG TPA: hypothetical protein PKI34_01190 [Bacteroidales bacterium]|nr:hypothetical protein [Bacteroidales bacterium]
MGKVLQMADLSGIIFRHSSNHLYGGGDGVSFILWLISFSFFRNSSR